MSWHDHKRLFPPYHGSLLTWGRVRVPDATLLRGLILPLIAPNLQLDEFNFPSNPYKISRKILESGSTKKIVGQPKGQRKKHFEPCRKIYIWSSKAIKFHSTLRGRCQMPIREWEEEKAWHFSVPLDHYNSISISSLIFISQPHCLV